MTAIDRESALSTPPPSFARRKVALVVAALVVFGVIGGVLGHDDSPPLGTTTAPPSTSHGAATTLTTLATPLSASVAAYMGLTTLAGDPAPAFSLTDQEGARVSLAGMHGDAVVLTFLDSAGPDLSSVETREIVQADRDLAGLSSHVLFVAINCDASAGSRAALVAFDRREGLTGIPNWRFLTAPAAQLRAVWSAYGITVSVDPHAPIVLHTEEILFISPTGAERFSVAPYGNQGPDGTYSLPQADIARWASGIADYASEMLH